MSEDFATDAALRKDLRAPFPPELLSKVDKGFGPIDTINHAVVTDRLNQVAPSWTYEITRFIEADGADGMKHLLAVFGYMRIGDVVRWEAGEVERPSTYGDEMKKAISDFIKRAAMRYGTGLDLWSREDLQTSQPEEPATRTGEVRVTEDMAVATAEGVEQGKVSTPDVAAAMSASFTDQDAPATDEQWERLLTMCDGNRVRAVSRLNRANHTDYTKETSYGATKGEVAKAIAGA